MKRDEEKRGDSSFAEGAVSILSVIKNGSREVHEIFVLPTVKKEEKNILKLFSLAKKKKIPIRLSNTEFFDSVTTGHTHGGVIASVGERKMKTPREVFKEGNGFVFMLCGIEDPFNFGCAVRSFFAAGAGGMILTPRNWLSAAGVTLRSSAGTTEGIACAVCTDPEEICKIAKEEGYQIVCASEKNSVDLYEADLGEKLFVIVGGEKRGISKDFLNLSDLSVCIPYGRNFSGSLTTSAAAAVIAFEILRRNKFKG